MSAPAPILATFTREDSRPRKCGRMKCTVAIVPGNPSTRYVGDINDPEKGYWVCKKCFEHYNEKSTTLRHQPANTASGPIQPSPAVLPPVQNATPPISKQATFSQRGQNVNVGGIEASSNHAQRRGQAQTLRAPVAALPPGHPVPLPPSFAQGAWFSPRPANQLAYNSVYTPTPHVGVPNPWDPRPGDYNPQLHSAPPTQAGAIGYSLNHANYEAERFQRAKMAYAARDGSDKWKVDLLVTFAREDPGSKNKWSQISTIQEGVLNVSALLNPSEIASTAKRVIQQRIGAKKLFKGFTLRWHEMDVRTNPGFVNLLSASQEKPLYLDECMHPSSGKGAKAGGEVFKKPNKAFALLVVMSAEHWEEWEMFEDAQLVQAAKPQLKKSDTSHSTRVESDSQFWDYSSKRARSASLEKSLSDALRVKPCQRSGTSSVASATQTVSSISTGLSDEDSDEVEEIPSVITTPKRASKTDVASGIQYLSPNQSLLRQRLLEGGVFRKEDASNGKTNVQDLPRRALSYYRIPQLHLGALINGSASTQFKLEARDMEFGHVHFSPVEYIGMGATKTAHRAHLVGVPRMNSDIVVKRVFMPSSIQDPGNSTITPQRYLLDDEKTHTLIEANLLYWAYSLMDDSYKYIDSVIASKEDPCPHNIPRLRFVKAGVAITDPMHVYKKKTTKGRATGTMEVEESMAVLIEEFIDEQAHGEFTKYIHNASAANFDQSNPTAEFLCCVQHIQYWKTGSMAYISDFQGAGDLLTDPQIITSPHLSQAAAGTHERADLFGSGNIEDGFIRFPHEHKCNKYCQWLNLPLLAK